MREAVLRPAWAEVDLGAVRHNAALLLERSHPAELLAVVKANGYGLGAVPVAEAALEGGATRLGVALVDEGMALREAGIDVPILLLSEPPPEAMVEAVKHRLTPTLYTEAGVEAAALAVGQKHRPINVEVKVDTGMHRVGADLETAVKVARLVHESPHLHLAGLWTHLAAADEPDNPYTGQQLERFEQARDRLAHEGVVPEYVHAANSAGAIAHPGARYDVVRCGIAMYGYDPSPALAGIGLRPALTLRARVSHVKELPEGTRLSYGLRYELPERSVVATVPLGYADGVPRRWFDVGGEVLIGGRRCPVAGTITMDQLVADCGPSLDVAVGDDVVLLGRQGEHEITADDWAAALGTINYEILCGIGPRVPRVYV